MGPCKGLFHYKGVLSHGLRTTGLATRLAHKGLRNGVTALHGHLSQGGFTLGTKTQARSPGEVLVLTYYFFLSPCTSTNSMGSDKKINLLFSHSKWDQVIKIERTKCGQR